MKDVKRGYCGSLDVPNASPQINLDFITTSELTINATLTTKTGTQQANNRNRNAISGIGANRSRKSSRSRISEMAKYMLEILDDLQGNSEKSNKNKSSRSTKEPLEDDRSPKQSVDHNKLPQNFFYSGLSNKKEGPKATRNDFITNNNGSNSSNSGINQFKSNSGIFSDVLSEISYNSLPEYHIYEEIMYEGFHQQKQQQYRTPVSYQSTCPYNGKANLLIDAGRQLVKTECESHFSSPPSYSQDPRDHGWNHGSWGRCTNRPKQRRNLYSLFSDPVQRRTISRSLEREFRSDLTHKTRTALPNEKNTNSTDPEVHYCEYGFKASV